MRLEHINLVVAEIEPTTAFLKIAFPHWRVRGQGNSPWYGKPRTWLHFGEDDFYIALSNNGEGKNRDLTKHDPGLAHIGFVVDDMDGIMERYREQNIEPASGPTVGASRQNVYYIDPTGLEFEFTQYLSDMPAERHNYDE